MSGSPLAPARPSLSFSLPTALLACSFLASLEPVVSLWASPSRGVPFVLGEDQYGRSQATPVKVLRAMPLRFQRRHGLPERSRARRWALIAPVFALGPSF